MAKNTLFERFFKSLAERLNKENDISDVTYSLLKASDNFKKIFFEYIFEIETLQNEPVEIHREYSEGISRPDFMFLYNGKRYILEVKKFDRNYHFEQYKEEFPDAIFAFISNYSLPPYNGIIIKQWSEFIKELEEKLKTLEDGEEKQLINGYIKFLKEALGMHPIEEFKNFSFKNVESLMYFYYALVEHVLQSNEDFEIEEYKGAKSVDYWRFGVYFSLKDKKTGVTIWPWIGIYFGAFGAGAEKNCIYIEINKRWCNPVYSKIKQIIDKGKNDSEIIKIIKNIKNFNPEIFEPPYYDDEYGECYIFELKQEKYKELEKPVNNKEDLFYRVEILKSFFNSFLEIIKNYTR